MLAALLNKSLNCSQKKKKERKDTSKVHIKTKKTSEQEPKLFTHSNKKTPEQETKLFTHTKKMLAPE